MIKKAIDWLAGKKTYIIAVIVAGLAVANYYGVAIPEYVWLILNAAGLGAIRASMPTKK